MIPLVVGSVIIPQDGQVALEQRYVPVFGGSRVRLSDGSLEQYTRWRRLRTEITGRGWVPLGLDLLDYDDTVLIDCVAPRSTITTATSVTLPGVRRPDADVVAHARLGQQDWVRTDVSVSGETATIMAVTDALQYQVRWYPRLTCWLAPPDEGLDVPGADWDWRLVGEEA
ncbi:hypothetical protein J2T57_002591 [Natronocella acetinitrilica]|uniref:Uncharacterized protein n=1 Tax=Natronocella acetinitrilica TaxID=414046 RepID=A0AAE3KC81_9GAMM|nr:hypothetical protein [Natronocella acetinitrilica]MCP1675441.1 hypothetical protein [Natronocella acetinitrilica]